MQKKGESMSNDAFQEMMQALNGHSVTNEDGDVTETETVTEDHQLEQKTTEDETAPVETTPEPEAQAPEAESSDPESEFAEDESGKKYIPEERFKKVYGKMKELERQVTEREQQALQGQQILNQVKQSKGKQPTVSIDKADVLELKLMLPQFNPVSPEYSPELDNLGFQILRANPGITPLEAGKQAIEIAKKFARGQSQAQSEARSVKSQQADNGMTSRVISRKTTQPDLGKMSDRELEKYLKETGNW